MSRGPIPFDADARTTGALQQLSHDIRSAMSDVLGGIRLIEPARLDAQTLTQFDRIRAAADTLANLVDDALLTAAGETLIHTPYAEVRLGDWITAMEQRWSGRAAERGRRFAVVKDGPLPECLAISAISLDRILGNLVGNALLHADIGDVVVELRCDPVVGFEICVTDQGAGFPPHVLDAEPGAMASTRGSGLGLRIVRELSRTLPATLTLYNTRPEGHGCARLLIAKDRVVWTAEGTPAPTEMPDLTGLRVLVAEDNLTNQTIIRQMLDAMGATSAFVADGVAALEVLQRDEFDIGLIDIEMPRLSGLEVMEQVRASPGDLAKIPLVAITAYVLRDNREAIYAAGADGIIGKPIGSAAEFGRTVLRHVGWPTGGPETQDVLAGSGFEPQMDEARLESLLRAAGPEGSAELLDRVSEDLTAVLAALDEGVAQVSVSDIRAQTHILIAISGAVGADRLCQMAEVLNIAAKRQKLEQLSQIHAHLRLDLVDLLRVVGTRRAALD